MSKEDTSNDSGPILGAVLTVLSLALPAGLIAMLGIFGVYLLVDAGKVLNEKAKAEAAAVAEAARAEKAAAKAAKAAPAPAPAPAAGGGDPEGASAAGESAKVAMKDDNGAVAPEVFDKLMKDGEKAFATCGACHGPDGTGLQVGAQKMAPSFVGSEITLGNPERLLLVVMKGIAKETPEYVGVMAPLETAFDNEALAGVATYVRNSWGNKADPVTKEMAAAVREKFRDVQAVGGIKRAELDQLAGE